MSRYQNLGEIYSALYVDFDNIYTRLSEQDPALGRTFATCPQRWLRWLEGHALRMMYGDGVRRRILKRCCYLNPIRYHEFRPFFIRSAFQVVDCPPLTNYGKTSADIHLVMDCMDALSHVTRFDEIIILSGDADFTPLLLRIQEHARRSLVLSVGYTSPAYAAACSWRIREDWFVAQALEEQREEGEERESRPSGERPPRQQHVDREESDSNWRADRAAKGGNINLPVFKRIRLVESIKQLVAESSVPVPLPSAVHVLQSEQEASPDWYGAGTLRDLLEVLDLAPVVFSQTGQGYVYDPERHESMEGGGGSDDFKRDNPELYDFALKVHRLVDVPMLGPQQYTLLLKTLLAEVGANGFSRAATIRRMETRCAELNLPLDGAQILFITEALIAGGVNLNKKSVQDLSLDNLRESLVKRVSELCKLLQYEVDDDELDMLEEWLGSDE
ncbi:NYN domain-containing protein [Desulfovibrio sp. OttesenSCG-928-A18]|nr:NYN domain-containing protein [Desulfovibrio sp. OttesenSCG-928-A18]